jgi:hypothetical protein
MASSVTAATTRTAVLLVTHQRLSGPGGIIIEAELQTPATAGSEVDEVRKIVDASFTDRPITVVYFPTTISDASVDAIENLKYAFNAGSDAVHNRLIVYSPYNSRYQLPDGDGRYATEIDTEDSNDEFLRYWMDLLNPDSDINIVNAATDVYNSLLRLERKF